MSYDQGCCVCTQENMNMHINQDSLSDKLERLDPARNALHASPEKMDSIVTLIQKLETRFGFHVQGVLICKGYNILPSYRFDILSQHH